MPSIKLHIKLGRFELDYEGSEEYLRTELSSVVNIISQLDVSKAMPENEVGSPQGSSSSQGSNPPTNTNIQMTTGTIAAKLNCASGTDLVMAAGAYLTLVSGQETFGRKEILQSMKSATAHYKGSYGSNLSTSINTLVKQGKLIERSKDRYALPVNQRSQIEARLAQ